MIMEQKEVNIHRLDEEMQDIAKRLKLKEISEALYFPKYFQIETTRLCNARCPYCACDQWDKSIPFISEDLFKKAVLELGQYSDWIEWVCVSRAGEPLLDKKISEHVRQFKEAGIKRVIVTTNAALLDRNKAIELIEAGLDEIMFSIDSIDKQEYEQIKIGLEYEKVIANIMQFFKLREELKSNISIRVRAVSFLDFEKKEQREKLINWENFWEKFKKPQDRIYMKKPHTWGNQKVWKQNLQKYDLVFHPCILPWSTLHITAMGTITLCPMDFDAKMNLGNFSKESIKEVWQGTKVEWIRRLHRNGRRNEISFCIGCKLFDSDFTLENKEGNERPF